MPWLGYQTGRPRGGWGRGTQAGRVCHGRTSVPLVCRRPVIPGAEVGGGEHKRDACATVEQASRLFADDRCSRARGLGAGNTSGTRVLRWNKRPACLQTTEVPGRGGWGRGTQAGRVCYGRTSVPLVCGRPVFPGAEVGGGEHKRDACATVEQTSRLFADDRCSKARRLGAGNTSGTRVPR